ncbi:hypothetical protein KBC79_03855 [Candidatus Woesebacteria bacterium]|nr:hypothetical protein [Candidatus Woesebacteria bacterium]
MQNSREVYKGDKSTSFKDSIDAAYARFTRLEFGSSKEKDTTEFLRHIAMTADMNYGYAAVSESFVDANKTSVIFLPVVTMR